MKFIVQLSTFCFLSGVIDVLVKNGRQIDAVNLAFAFELTEQFTPVSLLKSYLNEATKVSSPTKHGNTSPSAQVCLIPYSSTPPERNVCRVFFYGWQKHIVG